MTEEVPKLDNKADNLITTYLDPIPILPKDVSSRQYYEYHRSKLPNQVLVSHFNRVRFFSKFRQIDDEDDFLPSFALMDRFNALSDKMFEQWWTKQNKINQQQ